MAAPNHDEALGKPGKRQKVTPSPEAQPATVHRRKTSLRDRLIKGEYTPQAIGMRAHNMKKAAGLASPTTVASAAPVTAKASAATANTHGHPQEYPHLAESSKQNVTVTHASSAYNPTSASTTTAKNNAPAMQPCLDVAYKSTPIRQLHFPQRLVLALEQNKRRWEGRGRPENLIFVVTRLVGGDVADVRVFTTLCDATAGSLRMMVDEHPETFVLRRDDHGLERLPAGAGDKERYERASSVIRAIRTCIDPRLDPGRVPMPSGDPSVTTAHTNDSTATTTISQGGGMQNTSSRYNIPGVDVDNDREGLFTMEEEDEELLSLDSQASHLDDQSGGLSFGDVPEPVYVFCGSYKISSFGLKMEARRTDGAAVKVSVHLKNLRKPGHI